MILWKREGPIDIDVRPARNGFAPLYHRDPDKEQPQPAYVILRPLDRRPVLTAGWLAGTGSPRAIRMKWILWWSVSPRISADELAKLLDDITPLAAEVVAGYSLAWYGSSVVGELSPEAINASSKINRRCMRIKGSVRVVKPEDWVSEESIVRMLRQDNVSVVARRISLDATQSGVMLDGDVEKYVRKFAART
jgi:hypothetical protein